MNSAELVEFVYQRTGGEKNARMSRPMILALGTLALKDLAQTLIDSNSELAKKLIVQLTNQSWSASQFNAPANMLFYKQKKTTRMDFSGVLAYQVEDRDKLEMGGNLVNVYYALEGKTFYIANPAGTSGSNLNLRYYKIPDLADIDTELRNIFIELVLVRMIPQERGQQQISGESK